jgi:hypothetical protein
MTNSLDGNLESLREAVKVTTKDMFGLDLIPQGRGDWYADLGYGTNVFD